ncbi:MAG TPA: DUF721 domain-containing protein [Actinomycetota bacterium]|nr:DUF721 domain-containing protein [Actinomycetota bacterium]
MSGPAEPRDGGPAEPPAGEGIGEVIRGLLGDPRLRRGVSLGTLARSWARVVGPELAEETAPLALEGGSLLVAASSPGWAARVRFLAEDIRRRAARELGGDGVGSVKVTVGLRSRKPLRRNGSGGPERPAGMPGVPPPE